MILEKLILPELVNKVYDTSGTDSYHHCFNKSHFKNYPHQITYRFNSRGFRDNEWSNNLDNNIWCIGDSFTVGLGTPIQYTWTKVLEQVTNSKTINISMDGASNQWIARKTIDIINEISPKVMVIMWSYGHRREASNTLLTDLERRIHYKAYDTPMDDHSTFKRCIDMVIAKQNNTKLIHFSVPKALKDSALLNQLFENVDNYLGEVIPVDKARDSWHFDSLTSLNIANQINDSLSS